MRGPEEFGSGCEHGRGRLPFLLVTGALLSQDPGWR